MKRPRTGVAALLAVGGVLLASSALLASPVGIEKRTKITIELRPLTADLISEHDVGHANLVLDSEYPAETELGLAWPAPNDRSTLVVSASRVPPGAGGPYSVDFEGRLTLPDGSTVHAARSVSFDDKTTALFEVYRYGDRSLTLAVTATVTTEMVVTANPSPGSQVRFRLEIVKVVDGREVSLEDNFLNTLIGEPVTYAFRLADTREADAVTIELKPQRLHADIAEIDVEITGTMTLDEEMIVIGRTEHWLASRGATSTLAFEAGDPPSGYRFRITARF
jgi:hypothetical protein